MSVPSIQIASLGLLSTAAVGSLTIASLGLLGSELVIIEQPTGGQPRFSYERRAAPILDDDEIVIILRHPRYPDDWFDGYT